MKGWKFVDFNIDLKVVIRQFYNLYTGEMLSGKD